MDAKTGIISTIAGNGQYGFSGDGGLATSANLYYPYGLASDSIGNLYIADTQNHIIRKVDTKGIITTVAGKGSQWGFSGDGGLATSAKLYYPFKLAVDSSNNLYISDSVNMRIRRVDSKTGIISTIAGNPDKDSYGYWQSGYSGDNSSATSAKLSYPSELTIDPFGSLYIADIANSRIRKVTFGQQLVSPSPSPQLTCKDSDGGKNYYVKGIVYDNKYYINGGEDSCYSDFRYDHLVLNEYYCSGEIVQSETYDCPNGCKNGACVNLTSPTPVISPPCPVPTCAPGQISVSTGLSCPTLKCVSPSPSPLTGGTTKEVSFGAGASGGTRLTEGFNPFPAGVWSNAIVPQLKSGRIFWKGSDYDFKEVLSATGVRMRNDVFTDSINGTLTMEVESGDIYLAYRFDKSINITAANGKGNKETTDFETTDPVEISFLGKKFQIIGIAAGKLIVLNGAIGKSLTPTNGIEYTTAAGKKYTVYATEGSDNSWAKVSIKDSTGDEVNSATINKGASKDFDSLDLTIEITAVRAKQDNSVLGVDLVVGPKGKTKKWIDTAADVTSTGTSNDALFEGYPDWGLETSGTFANGQAEVNDELRLVYKPSSTRYVKEGQEIKMPANIRLLNNGFNTKAFARITIEPVTGLSIAINTLGASNSFGNLNGIQISSDVANTIGGASGKYYKKMAILFNKTLGPLDGDSWGRDSDYPVWIAYYDGLSWKGSGKPYFLTSAGYFDLNRDRSDSVFVLANGTLGSSAGFNYTFALNYGGAAETTWYINTSVGFISRSNTGQTGSLGNPTTPIRMIVGRPGAVGDYTARYGINISWENKTRWGHDSAPTFRLGSTTLAAEDRDVYVATEATADWLGQPVGRRPQTILDNSGLQIENPALTTASDKVVLLLPSRELQASVFVGAQYQPSPTEWKTYKSSDSLYEIKYPAGWELKDYGSQGASLIESKAADITSTGFIQANGVNVYLANKSFSDFTNAIESYLNTAKEIQNLLVKKDVIANRPAVIYTFEALAGEEVYAQIVAVDFGGKTLQLTMSSEASRLNIMESTFKEMLASLKVNLAPTPSPPPTCKPFNLNKNNSWVSSTNLYVGDTYFAFCDYGSVIDCIDLGNITHSSCKFSKFEGTAAKFECIANKYVIDADIGCRIFPTALCGSCSKGPETIGTVNIKPILCPSPTPCPANQIMNMTGTGYTGCSSYSCIPKPCMVEGESAAVTFNSPSSCCTGLAQMPALDSYGNKIVGVTGICTSKCGDGICDQKTENQYSCQKDCGPRRAGTINQTAGNKTGRTVSGVSSDKYAELAGYRIFAKKSYGSKEALIYVDANDTGVIDSWQVISGGGEKTYPELGFTVRLDSVQEVADTNTIFATITVLPIISDSIIISAEEQARFDKYRIFAVEGSNNSWAKVSVKDKYYTEIATATINKGSSKDFDVLGFKVNLTSVVATKDNVVVGAAVLVSPLQKPPSPDKCTDSDGGESYYVPGSVSTQTTVPLASGDYTTLYGDAWDVCDSDGANLTEYFCSGNKINSTQFKCQFGCRKGACLTEPSCEWRITNGCSESAGAAWGCVDIGKYVMPSPAPICTRDLSPKPIGNCTFDKIGGKCKGEVVIIAPLTKEEAAQKLKDAGCWYDLSKDDESIELDNKTGMWIISKKNCLGTCRIHSLSARVEIDRGPDCMGLVTPTPTPTPVVTGSPTPLPVENVTIGNVSDEPLLQIEVNTLLRTSIKLEELKTNIDALWRLSGKIAGYWDSVGETAAADKWRGIQQTMQNVQNKIENIKMFIRKIKDNPIRADIAKVKVYIEQIAKEDVGGLLNKV